MKTISIILAGFLAVSAAGGQTEERNQVKSFWPNGNMKMLGLAKKVPSGKLVMDGRVTVWFENGAKQSEENWKDGLREGPARYWNEAGKLVTQSYFRAGKLHGRLIIYWPNGKARSAQNYKEGIPSGKETRWYSNGQKAVEGHWMSGKRDGVWECWQRNGELLQTQTYENGHLSATTSPPSRWGRWLSGEYTGKTADSPSNFSDWILVADVLAPHRVGESPFQGLYSGGNNSYESGSRGSGHDYETSHPGDYKVTYISDYKAPDLRDYGLSGISDYNFSITDYEPPDPGDYEVPDPDDYEIPDISDYEAPEIDYDPPDISDYAR